MWTGFPFRNSSNNFVVVVVFLQEYQDDVRELLQIKDHTQKEAFLTKHTYDKFLKQVQQFFTPVWKKFGTPVLEEVNDVRNTFCVSCFVLWVPQL